MDEHTENLERIGLRDHLATKEYRIFGPPGTGKTTNLTRQIRRAADRFGDNGVLVTSFSKAAAAELTSRDTPMDLNRIGTLHSLCFSALGKPAIAEGHVDDWNRQNPMLKVTPVSRQKRLEGEDAIEDDERSKSGDSSLGQLNRRRGMMLAQESMSPALRDFAAKWSRYKTANGLLDFCDLIEIAYRDLKIAPHNPNVVLVDEAQDLNRLQFALIRRWAESAQYLVLAGDDDQTIYAWAGASPDAILDPEIPEDHKVFLQQSARVPRAVHAVAERLIRQVSRRQSKAYLPRPEDGDVLRLSHGGYHSPEYWILKSLERHLEQGRSIMFLATCSYMLHPVIMVLRKRGIPFHNPHRKSNGFWNPLRTAAPQSAANRLLALLTGHSAFGEGQRRWRFSDLTLCTEWLCPQGILLPNAIDVIAANPRCQEASTDFLRAIFQPDALEKLLTLLDDSPAALLKWWQTRLAPDFRKRIQFPADIVALRGVQGLRRPPQVVVGTIHSVKGGQADVVYLFPDLSKAADAQYRKSGPSRDSVIRTFYVGATRARETLYICAPEGPSISI